MTELTVLGAASTIGKSLRIYPSEWRQMSDELSALFQAARNEADTASRRGSSIGIVLRASS